MKSFQPEKPIKTVDDLEDFLAEWGADLGMPDPAEYDAECPSCNWAGELIETVFRDGEFYCPACNHQFVSRTD